MLYLYAPLWTRMNIKLWEMVNWLCCPTQGWSKFHTEWARFEQPAPAPDHLLLIICLALLHSLTGHPPFQSLGPHRDFWPHFWVTCCVSFIKSETLCCCLTESEKLHKHPPEGTNICISYVQPTHSPNDSPFPEHKWEVSHFQM